MQLEVPQFYSLMDGYQNNDKSCISVLSMQYKYNLGGEPCGETVCVSSRLKEEGQEQRIISYK